MNKLLLGVIGLMLVAIGYLMGRSGEPAMTPARASAGWNAEAGAYVSEMNGTLRVWKITDGEVVEVVEYSTALVQGDEGPSKDPVVFKKTIKPAADGAMRFVPPGPSYAPPPPAPIYSSCSGSGKSCG